MFKRVSTCLVSVLLAFFSCLSGAALFAEQIPVRYTQGLLHGFLVLHNLDGVLLADGDLLQVAHGDQVTSRLVLHFKDGSTHEETVVFSQRHYFRLISDHLVQKGPSFPHPMDVSTDASSGQIAVHYTDDDGKEKTASDHPKLSADLANGMILTLLQNLRPDIPQTTVSMVAATPKPRIVKLAITPRGEESFSIARTKRTATHYVVKVDIGGVAGVVAPLLGKQPADTQVWIMGGEAPAFVKMEGQLYSGGPIWRIELASPEWNSSSATASSEPK
jgi:hypothetical protein